MLLFPCGNPESAFKRKHCNGFKDAFLYLVPIAGIFITNLFEISKYLAYLWARVLHCLKKCFGKAKWEIAGSCRFNYLQAQGSSCLYCLVLVPQQTRALMYGCAKSKGIYAHKEIALICFTNAYSQFWGGLSYIQKVSWLLRDPSHEISREQKNRIQFNYIKTWVFVILAIQNERKPQQPINSLPLSALCQRILGPIFHNLYRA